MSLPLSFRFDPHGWNKGQRMEYKDGVPNHAMVLRGYANGVRDTNGMAIGCDKAFFFLRMRRQLDSYRNNREPRVA